MRLLKKCLLTLSPALSSAMGIAVVTSGFLLASLTCTKCASLTPNTLTRTIGLMRANGFLLSLVQTLRVKNCLYAHYTGPMAYSQLASSKLQILAFEKDLKLTGDNYTIFVSQDDDDAVVDVFMETK